MAALPAMTVIPITLAIDGWLFEQLMIFDAGAEELEEGGDAEPDDDP